jgi:sugar phosphate isomerase/epimerase
VYLYYGMQAPRERIGGYSTTAPPAAALVMDRLRPLQCGIWGEPRESLLRRLGVRYVVVHGGLYRASPLVPAACRARAERGLRRHGWRAVARDGPVALYSAPR